MNSEQISIISNLVESALNQAEYHWRNGGYKLIAESRTGTEALNKSAMDTAVSQIPGHEIVKEGETIVDDFIAIVADMRNSTNHMLNASSSIELDGIQRVFYETSALLPALEKTINIYKGGVTEYLGDGVLGFFKKDKENPEQYIYDAHNAAKDCLKKSLEIVNSALSYRYNLPPLKIGIGLALSKALVSLSGIEGSRHAKAYGECVFRATKLSGGNNVILIDNNLRVAWPSSKGGKLSFVLSDIGKGGVQGYRINGG
ncbi:TPA: adenylate/guanylate cyclase domain-containing protein [Klebsiella pneumoniae subsp. pneumoniae]|uniref:adenylate/guanylate cyclase n=1 Tax=Klebsiella pneumoniae TaxID=573 RepID=UPI0021192F88|nr:adenylate/guanylate cyclase [Klebsiella pneumoniae]HDU3661299.1 adenylate/guanylate cyclase domain-containing protein [Klebsiella pneumoniae subsp. pneumoniae]MCQ8625473.1 adenylate/guanylate cyclase [Klebsiella pneumoniae]HDU3722929.1 adenylate/guanylate cyclase domain-containing protein [Klebsiella pneumoniae subsp. pneumoniae]HDU3735639.1 adenylate/guanylate cyclase domain-containing protein [Klebsiella pneumoniae subsp. pneumoniae]HDU5899965.1 adenylate/guanylate cyclase domain-containi